jgi:membrane protease YdiL (CAAX protease family)
MEVESRREPETVAGEAQPSRDPARATIQGRGKKLLPLAWILIALVIISIPSNLVRTLMQRLDTGVLRAAGVPVLLRSSILPALANILTVALAYHLYVRWVERRRVSELSAKRAPLEIASGVLLGAFLFAVTIGLLAVLGAYHVTGQNPLAVAIAPIFTFAAIGFGEEVVVRGILFRLLEKVLGTWLALATSAALFGIAHAMNPHSSAISTIAIALEAGILLAAAFMFTRRLWLPIAIHFGWNFTQGAVFGAAVSGMNMQGILKAKLSGPTLLSGGEFGPEASIVAGGVCLLAAAALLRAAMSAGRVIAPIWAPAPPPAPE